MTFSDYHKTNKTNANEQQFMRVMLVNVCKKWNEWNKKKKRRKKKKMNPEKEVELIYGRHFHRVRAWRMAIWLVPAWMRQKRVLYWLLEIMPTKRLPMNIPFCVRGRLKILLRQCHNTYKYFGKLHIYFFLICRWPTKRNDSGTIYGNWIVTQAAHDNYAMHMSFQSFQLIPVAVIDMTSFKWYDTFFCADLSINCTWNSPSTWSVRMNSNMRCSLITARALVQVH